MRESGLSFLIGLVLLVVWPTGAGVAQAGAGLDTPVPQEAICRIENEYTIQEILDTYNATLDAIIFGGSRPHYLLGLPPEISETEFVMLAENDERIKDAELNYTAAAPEPGTGGFFLPSRSELYPRQSATLVTDLARASYVESPSPIIVAVIDTGVDSTHPRLASCVLDTGVSLVPESPTTEDVGDGADNDGDGLIDELVGHGTFVAGLVHLVAPDAQILPIRVLDGDGGSNVFRVAQGVREAINRGADVITMSLGSTEDVSVLGRQIDDATALGIVVLASVGNDNTQDPLRYPSADVGVIGVAGTNNVDVRASFSNYGTHVDLTAPAVDVISTFPGGTYASSSGTSYSTPLVAGLAARILAVDPTLSGAQVTQTIIDTSVPIDALNPGFEGLLGAGRIDVNAAMQALGLRRVYGDVTGDGELDQRDLTALLGGRDATRDGENQQDEILDLFHAIVRGMDGR